MIQMLIGVVVVALFTPAIAWAVARWAEREAQAERERFDRIMASQVEDQNLKLLQASKPTRAAGFDRDRKRVS